MYLTVRDRSTDKTATFAVDIGDNLQELVKRYGEDTVYRCALEKIKSLATNIARNALNRGSTGEEVTKRMESEWRPFTRMSRKSVIGEMDESWFEELDDIGG